MEAERWLGAQEIGGNNRGQIIRMFQRAVGKAEDEPWCMSFVQYCCNKIDQIYKIVRKANDINKLYQSEHCLTVWNKTPHICRQDPAPGTIAIWNYKGGSAGHAGIVVEVDGEIIRTIEGNTSDNTKRIVREGDGVYRKRRPINSISNMQLKGFLDPWPL